MEKYIYYAALISNQIAEMFKEDAENYINPSSLADAENFKAFFIALSVCVPRSYWNKLQTSEPVDTLEFNHIMNRLIFENFSGTEETNP